MQYATNVFFNKNGMKLIPPTSICRDFKSLADAGLLAHAVSNLKHFTLVASKYKLSIYLRKLTLTPLFYLFMAGVKGWGLLVNSQTGSGAQRITYWTEWNAYILWIDFSSLYIILAVVVTALKIFTSEFEKWNTECSMHFLRNNRSGVKNKCFPRI